MLKIKKTIQQKARKIKIETEKVGRLNTTPQTLSKTTATKTLAARPKISVQPHHMRTTQPVTTLLLTAGPGSALFLMSGAGKLQKCFVLLNIQLSRSQAQAEDQDTHLACFMRRTGNG